MSFIIFLSLSLLSIAGLYYFFFMRPEAAKEKQEEDQ